jgi:hypothetical protein
LAKHGLAAASRLNNTKEIEDYIELTFRKNLAFLTKTKRLLRFKY